MSTLYNSTDPKTKDYLAKIGEVIVTLNGLERDISFWIWELLAASGTPAEKQVIGRLVTNPLDFMGKINLLRSLIVHRLGEVKGKDFIKTYTLLQNCAEFRNDIAHSLWFIQYGSSPENLETEKINEVKAFQKGKRMDYSKAVEKINIEEFDNALLVMQDASKELLKFSHQHFI